MNIIEVKNPIYSRADKSMIDCLVTFEGVGELPYTAAAHDNEEHGKQLWVALNVGKYGEIAPYVENR